MRLNQDVDTRAVLRGVGIALVPGLGGGFAGGLLPDRSSIRPVLAIIILVAIAFGGYVAAKPHSLANLTAGGMAGFGAGCVLQLVNIVVAAMGGRLTTGSLVTVAFFLLVSTSLGFLGGYVAFARNLRRANTEPTQEPA